MRVLLIANTLPPRDLSGVGEQVVQLAAGLRARGHEVEVLGRGGAGARGSKLFFPLRIVGPAMHEVRRFAPDVVQLHESDCGLLASRLFRPAARAQARPLVMALLQVSYLEERRAVRPLLFGEELLGEPGSVELRFRRLKAPLQIALGRRTVRHSDLVLAPSAATAAELVRDYGAHRTAVLPNASGGLELAPQAPEGVDPEARNLLFVGRLRVRKGVEVLLRALALLGERGGAMRLRIAGEGEHRAALEEAALRFGVRDRVDFLGRRSAAEVRWLLGHTAALVVPSIYEGMPLVILEAMGAGLPVVASRVSGIPEVVEDPGTGWLVPAEDPPALAAALAELAENPQEARRRGERGRQRLEERYRPEKIAALWESIVAEAQLDQSARWNRSEA